MSAAIEVRERPILFSGEMVRAILEKRKTQTRRVVRPQPADTRIFACRNGAEWCDDAGVFLWDAKWEDESGRHGEFVGHLRCPYGRPLDRLWVREAVYIDQMPYDRGTLPKDRPGDLDERSIYYRADGECCDQIPECCCAEVGKPRWRPSIHMPRWASRITLEITDVRVERVQEISREDAIAEGVFGCGSAMDAATYRAFGNGNPRIGPVEYFRELWDSINGPRGYGWDANPWVWMLAFRRVEG